MVSDRAGDRSACLVCISLKKYAIKRFIFIIMALRIIFYDKNSLFPTNC